MPLYEYRCTQCGYRFEKIQTFGAEPETECPKCHGELKRPLTAPALQFKGSGWYVNDYAPKGSPSSSEGDAAGSGKPDSGQPKPASESTAKPAAAESSSKPAATESAPKSAKSTASS